MYSFLCEDKFCRLSSVSIQVTSINLPPQLRHEFAHDECPQFIQITCIFFMSLSLVVCRVIKTSINIWYLLFHLLAIRTNLSFNFFFVVHIYLSQHRVFHLRECLKKYDGAVQQLLKALKPPIMCYVEHHSVTQTCRFRHF